MIRRTTPTCPYKADDEQEAQEGEARRKVEGGVVSLQHIALSDVPLDRPCHAET